MLKHTHTGFSLFAHSFLSVVPLNVFCLRTMILENQQACYKPQYEIFIDNKIKLDANYLAF